MDSKEREALRMRRDEATRHRHIVQADLDILSAAWEDIFTDLALLDQDIKLSLREIEDLIQSSYVRARAALGRVKLEIGT